MAPEKRPVIVTKGTPEWIITFGDMSSLLLAFFILLYSVANLKDAGKVYDLIYALQGKFASSRPVHGYLLPNYKAMVDDLQNEAETKARHFGERGIHSNRTIESEGEGFHSLRARDHLKIIIEGSTLFEEGSTALLEDGKRILEKLMVPRFQDGPFRIIIRGHAAPGEGPSAEAEDDLGFERAREVRDFFLGKGIPAERFELQTIGSRSAAGEGTSEGSDVRRHLRRVEIYVSPQAVGPPIEASRRQEEK